MPCMSHTGYPDTQYAYTQYHTIHYWIHTHIHIYLLMYLFIDVFFNLYEYTHIYRLYTRDTYDVKLADRRLCLPLMVKVWSRSCRAVTPHRDAGKPVCRWGTDDVCPFMVDPVADPQMWYGGWFIGKYSSIYYYRYMLTKYLWVLGALNIRRCFLSANHHLLDTRLMDPRRNGSVNVGNGHHTCSQ